MQERISWAEYRAKVKLSPLRSLFLNSIGIIVRFTLNHNLRKFLYRMMGIKIGKGGYVGYDCYFDTSFPELITVEDNVIISFRVIIVAHDRAKKIVAPVVIKNGAFIGAGAIILPSVTIGENSIVGAGAVVSRDVAPRTVVVSAKLRESENIR